MHRVLHNDVEVCKALQMVSLEVYKALYMTSDTRQKCVPSKIYGALQVISDISNVCGTLYMTSKLIPMVTM